MPWTQQLIGYADGEHSREAARVIETRSSGQCERYIALLQRFPAGLTDHEASRLLKMPLSSICGRRGELNARAKASGQSKPIQKRGSKEGPHGIRNARWVWSGYGD